MATATKTTRGFKVRCPHCGDENTLRIDVDNTSRMTCSQCEEEVYADDIREIMGQYARLLKWLDTAPPIED